MPKTDFADLTFQAVEAARSTVAYFAEQLSRAASDMKAMDLGRINAANATSLKEGIARLRSAVSGIQDGASRAAAGQLTQAIADGQRDHQVPDVTKADFDAAIDKSTKKAPKPAKKPQPKRKSV